MLETKPAAMAVVAAVIIATGLWIGFLFYSASQVMNYILSAVENLPQ